MKSKRILVIFVEDGEEEKTVLHALFKAAHDLEDGETSIPEDSMEANINIAMRAREEPFLIESVGFVPVHISIQHPRSDVFEIDENLYVRKSGRSFYDVAARAREFLNDWKHVASAE